jgi:hypothetical protein
LVEDSSISHKLSNQSEYCTHLELYDVLCKEIV